VTAETPGASTSAAPPESNAGMIRVYVDGHGVDVHVDATAIDAVERWNPDEARAVREGSRAITDARGLPASLHAPLRWGSILRVVSARARAADANDAPQPNDAVADAGALDLTSYHDE
jgi:hypothetical protein